MMKKDRDEESLLFLPKELFKCYREHELKKFFVSSEPIFFFVVDALKF